MKQWSEMRERVLVDGESRRQIIRETGLHWDTLKKILTHSEPPGYRQRKPRPKTKLGPYLKRVEQILKEDQAMPRKQRHTAKRLWERLREDGFTGGYTVVKDLVRELTQRQQEVFVPLVHRPGEAQVDFGQALIKLNGQLRKVAIFVMVLPYCAGHVQFVCRGFAGWRAHRQRAGRGRTVAPCRRCSADGVFCHTGKHTMKNESPFGPVIFSYSRSQAVADGVQVEVTKTAQEAGIKFPMFLTRAVFDKYVAVPPDVTGQDEAGRLWDVVWMTRFAILRSHGHTDRLPVALYVRNDDRTARLVKLIATCGALDADDPQPAITVMLPDED